MTKEQQANFLESESERTGRSVEELYLQFHRPTDRLCEYCGAACWSGVQCRSCGAPDTKLHANIAWWPNLSCS